MNEVLKETFTSFARTFEDASSAMQEAAERIRILQERTALLESENAALRGKAKLLAAMLNDVIDELKKSPFNKKQGE